MRLKGKNILLISPEDWGESWVSKHHYADILAERSNRVFFLNRSFGETQSVRENLFTLGAHQMPKGLSYFPPPLRRRYHRNALRNLERVAGAEFDLLLSFDATRFMDLDVLGVDSVYFMADFNPKFHWKLTARSATLCVACSTRMVEQLRLCNANSHFLQHGHRGGKSPNYSFNTEPPNVVYAGNLGHHQLDRKRILGLVTHYPRVNFHFFGDNGTGNLGTGQRADLAKNLEQKPNCHLHGVVRPDKLHGIYAAADALLLSYKPGFDQIGNPHKMMGYLASGTPILSTTLSEYSVLNSEIAFADDLDTYLGLLSKLLNGDFDSGGEKRRKYARSHSYEAQLGRLENLLAKNF